MTIEHNIAALLACIALACAVLVVHHDLLWLWPFGVFQFAAGAAFTAGAR